MGLSEQDALRAYAAMMNTLNADVLEPFLAEDFVYESQSVLSALRSKQEFLAYIRPKLETIRNARATVYAEMGRINAYGKDQPCVVLAQNSPSNLVALVLATVEGGMLARLDMCVVPPPQSASRSGEYPA